MMNFRLSSALRGFCVKYLITSLLLSLTFSTAQGAVIGTQDALQIERGAAALERVQAILTREDARAALERFGVDPALALARVEMLTPAEAAQLADGLEALPAGSIGVIEVLGITALVLLILELVGVTDIFKSF
ncbi:MAG: PA2779 family protein [Pseudomonadales bacterium]